jgi:hypothetical protein
MCINTMAHPWADVCLRASACIREEIRFNKFGLIRRVKTVALTEYEVILTKDNVNRSLKSWCRFYDGGESKDIADSVGLFRGLRLFEHCKRSAVASPSFAQHGNLQSGS